MKPKGLLIRTMRGICDGRSFLTRIYPSGTISSNTCDCTNLFFKHYLMLPIQIKDVINEYVFVFDVNYVYNYPDRLNLE